MKTSKNLLSVFCISVCAGLMSCGGDETPSVSAENAKIAFSTTNQDLAQDIGSMLEAPGYTAMNSLSSLTSSSNPFGRMASFKRNEVKAQIKSSMYALRTTLLSVAANGRVNGDEPFNYNAKKGVYTWNSGTETFDRTDSDIIKFSFPRKSLQQIMLSFN